MNKHQSATNHHLKHRNYIITKQYSNNSSTITVNDSNKNVSDTNTDYDPNDTENEGEPRVEYKIAGHADVIVYIEQRLTPQQKTTNISNVISGLNINDIKESESSNSELLIVKMNMMIISI